MLPERGGNTRRLRSQELLWPLLDKEEVGLDAGKEKEWRRMR